MEGKGTHRPRLGRPWGAHAESTFEVGSRPGGCHPTSRGDRPVSTGRPTLDPASATVP